MIPPGTLRLWHNLEVQRIELFNSIADLENEVLIFRVAENKWHILEIIQHLVMSEKLSMIYLKKKWKYTKDLPSKTIVTDLRSRLLLFYMWIPIPLKAPARVRVFDPDKTISDIQQEWDKIRTEMKNFLKEMDPEIYQKAFYKHPAVGKITLHQMLLFFYAHIKRHKKQILWILMRINTQNHDRL